MSKASIVDCVLISSIGAFTFSQSYFTTDEAYKYVNPHALFWCKYAFGFISAALIPIKAFLMMPGPPKNGVDNPKPQEQTPKP